MENEDLFYLFKNEMDVFLNNNKNSKFVVALSGGIDSLSLLFLLEKYSKIHNIEFVAITIDHKLRKNSSKEASEISNFCKDRNICDHYVFEIRENSLSKGNIQENARKERYKLLTDWCRKNNFDVILTAHNFNDQIENILIKLSHGGGIYSFSIKKLSYFSDIKIFRPLINVEKKFLKNYLISKNINWWEDESNISDKYLRNKLRKISNEFLNLIENQKRLSSSIENINRASESLNFFKEQFLSTKVFFSNLGYAKFNSSNYINLPTETRFSILRDLLLKIRGNDIKIRIDSLKLIDERIFESQFFKLSKNDLIIERGLKNNDTIIIYRKIGKNKPSDVIQKKGSIWDNRFLILETDLNYSLYQIDDDDFNKIKSKSPHILDFDEDISILQKREILLSLPVCKMNNTLDYEKNLYYIDNSTYFNKIIFCHIGNIKEGSNE